MTHAPEDYAEFIPLWIAVIPCLLMFWLCLRQDVRRREIWFALAGTTVAVFVASSLFTRSFYSIFAASFLVVLLFVRWVRDASLATRYAHFWGLSSLFSLAVLKWNCFAEGCCWGRFCTMPWAVYYRSSTLMPFLYVPVHPVQLYESIVALVTGIFFLWLRRRKGFDAKQMVALYGLALATGRLATGYFRGDARPETLWWGVEINLWVSLLFILGSLLMLFRKRLPGSKVSMALLAAFVGLVGCLPQPVQLSEFSRTRFFPNGVEKYVVPNNPSRMAPVKSVKRNLLYLFGDELFSGNLNPQIQDYYKNDQATLESLAWWQYMPVMKDTYTKIYRIPQSKIGYRNLIDTILELESLGESYDIALLSHGYPNYLTTGQDYFFSKTEFALLPPLKHLHMVYMQGCYSNSLMNSWQNLGAKYVIGYDGANENVFWFYFFLRWYRWDLNNLPYAFRQTNDGYRWSIEKSVLFSKGVEMIGEDLPTYLKNVSDPILLGPAN